MEIYINLIKNDEVMLFARPESIFVKDQINNLIMNLKQKLIILNLKEM